MVERTGDDAFREVHRRVGTGATGETLGALAGVVLCKPTGTIAYAILASGGMRGVGRRYRAVLGISSPDDARGHYATPLVREDLVLAPEILPRAVARWDDADARDALYRH